MSTQRLRNMMLALAAAILSLTQALPVSAWGPERPTYTMEAPADHPTFNSIINNSKLGDERDFVRIVEKDSGNIFTSDLEIEPDKEYVVSIYYHNNASATYNDAAHNYAGVARDTRVISYFPDALKAGETGKIDGMIMSSNADPEAVWDEAYITAKDNLTIEHVDGTAKIYNEWETNGVELDKSLFTSEGAFIGLNELNGIILGCDEYSGMVYYNLRTIADGDSIPDDVEKIGSEPKGDADKKVAPEKTINTTTIVTLLAVAAIILAIVITKLHKKQR